MKCLSDKCVKDARMHPNIQSQGPRILGRFLERSTFQGYPKPSPAAVAFTAAALFLSSDSWADEFIMESPDPVFRGEVFGPDSRDANPAKWQATFVFRGIEGSECTATAVGSRAVLTAAHCMSADAIGKIGAGEKGPKVTCQRHPSYISNKIADFALCLVAEHLPVPKDGFEIINIDPTATPINAPVKLVGFGCRTKGGSDQVFGRLREGDSKVISTEVDQIMTGGGGSTICLGDSGGGAYLTIDDAQIRRRLVAINRKSDLESQSWLSLTASPLFINWARIWRNDRHVTICGLDFADRNCHQ